MAKNLVLGPILTHLAQIQDTKFFFQKFDSISHLSDKTNDPILRKLNDGWMDGWMNGSIDRQLI